MEPIFPDPTPPRLKPALLGYMTFDKKSKKEVFVPLGQGKEKKLLTPNRSGRKVKVGDDTLVSLVERGLTSHQIAEHANVTVETVRRRLRMLGLQPARGQTGPKTTVPDEALRRLAAKGLTVREIANRVLLTENAIRVRVRRLGIPVKLKSRRLQPEDVTAIRDHIVSDHWPVRKIAEKFKVTPQAIYSQATKLGLYEELRANARMNPTVFSETVALQYHGKGAEKRIQEEHKLTNKGLHRMLRRFRRLHNWDLDPLPRPRNLPEFRVFSLLKSKRGQGYVRTEPYKINLIAHHAPALRSDVLRYLDRYLVKKNRATKPQTQNNKLEEKEKPKPGIVFLESGLPPRPDSEDDMPHNAVDDEEFGEY